ncbi:hypothetical protein ACQPXM_33540 [Kribbella sp. CA-253562]
MPDDIWTDDLRYLKEPRVQEALDVADLVGLRSCVTGFRSSSRSHRRC